NYMHNSTDRTAIQTLTANIVNNTWYHIVSTWGRNSTGQIELKLYRNGVLIKEDPFVCCSKGLTEMPTTMYIGRDATAQQYEAKAIFDEIRIYNRSLTSQEIQQHYYSNLKKYNSSYWEFYSKQQNLGIGDYNYNLCAEDIFGSLNCTGIRSLSVIENYTCENQTYFIDADNDTYGNPVISISSCIQPIGYVLNNTDCNDNNSSINPSASEICNDSIDNNCNNLVDGNDSDCPNCFDSDNGLDYYVKGICRSEMNNFTDEVDFCLGGSVMDSACYDFNSTDGICGGSLYACPNGCFDGACNPSNLTCSLTNASWSHTNVENGTQVEMIVEGENCDGKAINFTVMEDDGFGIGNDYITSVIDSFDRTTWTALYYPDGLFGINDPPEYYFIATLSENSSVSIDSRDYSALLEVNETVGSYCGDAICDAGENCGNCAVDCITPAGQVCCGNNLYIGNCCVDANCSSGYFCNLTLHQCQVYPSCPNSTCDTGEECSADCSSELYCSDLKDNDQDSCIDSTDSECGGTETGNCADSLDNDCDGQEDCEDSDCSSAPICISGCVDSDGDKFNISMIGCGVADCDDSDALEFPGQIWHIDSDGDKYYNGTNFSSCERPTGYFAGSELYSLRIDCNDNNASINPGALDKCGNGLDEDCSGADDRCDRLSVNTSYYDGATTNFASVNLSNFKLVLEKRNYGKIEFLDNVSIQYSFSEIYGPTNISRNFSFTNSTLFPSFQDKPAIIHLYNLSFSNPRIRRNGYVCDVCYITNWSGGNLTFNITGFSTYVVEETPSTANDDNDDNDDSGGGDDSGGCTSFWSCGPWGTCVNGIQFRTCNDTRRCNPPSSRAVTNQSCGTGLNGTGGLDCQPYTCDSSNNKYCTADGTWSTSAYCDECEDVDDCPEIAPFCGDGECGEGEHMFNCLDDCSGQLMIFVLIILIIFIIIAIVLVYIIKFKKKPSSMTISKFSPGISKRVYTDRKFKFAPPRQQFQQIGRPFNPIMKTTPPIKPSPALPGRPVTLPPVRKLGFIPPKKVLPPTEPVKKPVDYVEFIRPEIENRLKQGYSQEKIKEHLVSKKWPENIINVAFKQIDTIKEYSKSLGPNIKNLLSKGYTKEQVMAKLLDRNWPLETVKKVFKELNI
ncbi:MAG: MopE-related protein, partial [archaeon]